MIAQPFMRLIQQLTIPCADDGKAFIRRDRLERIREILKTSPYVLYGERPLAFLYKHVAFDESVPVILISSHIDSLYTHYQVRHEQSALIGTFDNSICNAIVTRLMTEDKLPHQALVAFTGNEEKKTRGAKQTVQHLKDGSGIFDRLEWVIVTDITEKGYPDRSYTFENLFRRKNRQTGLMKFSRRKEMKHYLRSIMMPAWLMFVDDAEEDESWEYDEYDLNVASLCLPCQPIDGDMHSNAGVRIQEKAVEEYCNGLCALASGIAEDLEERRRRNV